MRPRTEPVRITSAAPNARQEMAGRQRRYLLSMSLRTICFVGAVLVGDIWLRWVLVAGAVVLPYVAVVAANIATRKTDSFAPAEIDRPALGYTSVTSLPPRD